MSSETRVLRPFAGLDRLQSLIDEAHLGVGDRRLEPGSRHSMAARDFIVESVSVLLPTDGRSFADELAVAVEEAGLETSEVVVHVILETARLKLAGSVGSWKLGELPSELAIAGGLSNRPAQLQAPVGGCTVTLAVVLDQDRDGAPLQPRRRGTWLARSGWSLVTDLGSVGFTPVPLTPAVRQMEGLPAGTVRYFVCDNVTVEGSTDDSLTVYVDEDVLATLNDQPTRGAAKLMQLDLFLGAMRAVVAAAAREISGEGATLAGCADSLAGRLALMIAGSSVVNDAANAVWHDMSTRPERVLALLEDRVSGLSTAFMHALGE